jgi:hypothetical protein
MAVAVIRCSCGARFRILVGRKDTAAFHAHFGRSVECDGTCRKTSTDAPADPVCATRRTS